jgi:hypothetical protein
MMMMMRLLLLLLFLRESGCVHVNACMPMRAW